MTGRKTPDGRVLRDIYIYIYTLASLCKFHDASYTRFVESQCGRRFPLALPPSRALELGEVWRMGQLLHSVVPRGRAGGKACSGLDGPRVDGGEEQVGLSYRVVEGVSFTNSELRMFVSYRFLSYGVWKAAVQLATVALSEAGCP